MIFSSSPLNGELSLVGLQATYTPYANFNGSDGFVYMVGDGTYTSNLAEVSINVISQEDPPTAEDVEFFIYEDEPTEFVLLSYDVDSNDDDISFEIISFPEYGVLVENRAIASYIYTPNQDYNGQDSFIYQVSDGNVYSQQAVATITVLPTNDPPTANDYNMPLGQEIITVDFNLLISEGAFSKRLFINCNKVLI